MSQYLTHLAALTLHQVQPLQPRLASRFETPVDMGVPEKDGIPLVEESPVSSLVPTQSSPIAATNSSSPVTQKVMTEFNDGQTRKEPRKQDQFTVEHTEFVIKPPDPNNEQKLALNQKFTIIDTEPVNRVAPFIIQPVTQPSDTVSGKEIPPKQHTLVERVREHFTETTHHEFVIKEVTTLPSDARQKTGVFKEPPLSVPVKPSSIVVRSEQSLVESNKPNQFGNQQTPSHQFDIDVMPAPTIQVSIGRIEIRATQVADKPITKPRTVSNTMSLEDYLKQRGGGKS